MHRYVKGVTQKVHIYLKTNGFNFTCASNKYDNKHGLCGWLAMSCMSWWIDYLDDNEESFVWAVARCMQKQYTCDDWNWIKKGLLISLPFFIGTVASNVIEFSDIYMIKGHFGLEGNTQVGIYSFFVGMGNIVQMFVQSAILIVFAPKLLESFSKDKFDG